MAKVDWTDNSPNNSLSNMAEITDGKDISASSTVEALRNAVFRLEAHARKPWGYLPTTAPTGVIAPNCVYQFDGGASALVDRMSLATAFTANTSNPSPPGWPWYGVASGLVGVHLGNHGSGEHKLAATAADAQHLITGALTIELLIAPGSYAKGAYSNVMTCGRVDATNKPAENAIYSITRSADTSTARFTQEVAAGGSFNSTDPKITLHTGLQLLTITRDSAGTAIAHYLDGQLLDSEVLAAGTGGGASSQLQIGAVTGDAVQFEGLVCGLRLTAAEMTAAQVLLGYRQVRGLG